MYADGSPYANYTVVPHQLRYAVDCTPPLINHQLEHNTNHYPYYDFTQYHPQQAPPQSRPSLSQYSLPSTQQPMKGLSCSGISSVSTNPSEHSPWNSPPITDLFHMCPATRPAIPIRIPVTTPKQYIVNAPKPVETSGKWTLVDEFNRRAGVYADPDGDVNRRQTYGAKSTQRARPNSVNLLRALATRESVGQASPPNGRQRASTFNRPTTIAAHQIGNDAPGTMPVQRTQVGEAGSRVKVQEQVSNKPLERSITSRSRNTSKSTATGSPVLFTDYRTIRRPSVPVQHTTNVSQVKNGFESFKRDVVQGCHRGLRAEGLIRKETNPSLSGNNKNNPTTHVQEKIPAAGELERLAAAYVSSSLKVKCIDDLLHYEKSDYGFDPFEDDPPTIPNGLPLVLPASYVQRVMELDGVLRHPKTNN